MSAEPPAPDSAVAPAPARPRGLALESPWLAIAVMGLALIATCGVLGLFEPTETRYAEIAREMAVSGDWLTPRLDGIHHFHKPPLPYWSAAAFMNLVGANAWGARLPVALANIMTLALAAWIAARRFEALGVRAGSAAWVLGTMLLFAVVGRALSADPFLTLSVAWFWALAPSSWALAALGLGFMAKGPVVFLHTALPVLAAAAWARDRRFLALLGPRRGWWAFAAVALPWYLALAALNPGLLSYWLGNQVVERVATETHGRGGPPWYFVAVLIAGSAPWTVAMGVGLARTWRERAHPEARLLLCWLLAPAIFLSFSGSKLPSYLLPCLPAAAFLAARGLESRAAAWGAGVVLAGLAVAGFVAGGAALARAAGSVGSTALPPGGMAACALLGLAAIAAAARRHAVAALMVTAALTVTGVAAAGYESALGSPRRIVRLLAEQRAGEPVVEIGHFNAGLPFYLGEKVPLIEVPREAGFEDRKSLAAAVAPRDSLRSWTVRHGRVWSFGREAQAAEIAEALGLRYVTLARWRKEALGVFTLAR